MRSLSVVAGLFIAAMVSSSCGKHSYTCNCHYVFDTTVQVPFWVLMYKDKVTHIKTKKRNDAESTCSAMEDDVPSYKGDCVVK